MKVFTLQRQQLIPASRAEVFEFFSRPENLASLTPSGLGFDILTPSPIAMKQGTLIDYTIRVASIPVRWTTLITNFSSLAEFVDVQLKGPYSFWHHTHEFSEVDGGTQMTDTVRYAMPFGILGSIVRALFVRRQLETIFDFREQRLKEIFPLEERIPVISQRSYTRRKKR